jgi:acetolactate synthase-1/2/3 large subunit
MTPRNGGRIVADALVKNGVERIFCVPGESYLALLDALYDTPIAVTVARQEGGAAMMAEAWGKLTGRPGIVMATRGPGATNAAAGLHVGRHDSTPMILLLGQVGRAMRGRDSFQEIDPRSLFASLAKSVEEVGAAERLPEAIQRAFAIAISGRPGPVVVSLPEDMLRETASVADARPLAPVEPAPGPGEIAALEELLRSAKRPLVILGGSGWSAESADAIRRFAERLELPVATSFRRQMLFDNDHSNYAGDVGIAINPALAARVRRADLLVLIGARMSEMPSSGYTLIDIPEPRQALVHVHPGADELGRLYRPTLAINAGPAALVAALENVALTPGDIAWREETRTANAEFRKWTEPVGNPGTVQLAPIMRWLRDRLPDDAIVTNGAGNYTGWLHRFYRVRRYGTQLGPTSGTMGYGLPAAIAAKLRHPERPVVAFAGDGCFQLTSQEFATAVQENAAIVLVVVNNGVHGTIRMHQERDYPGRVIATDLRNPDFAALARAHGGHGETVSRTEDFAGAFDAAMASGKPAIIDLKFDPEASTTGATLSQIRGRGKR